MKRSRFDVVIIGGGLAGLSLARHLQLTTTKTVLLLEKWRELPPRKQKVGESTVQVGAYYFGKVLDLYEYMFHDQFMKYNLRFYWKSSGNENCRLEDFSQSYIRMFSNIPCYQLDRNTLEAELLRRVMSDARVDLATGIQDLQVELRDDCPHKVAFDHEGRAIAVEAKWVVDTTGRGRFLARQLAMREPGPIRHGTSFMWVEGLVDIEKLTDRSLRDIRLNKQRRSTGHLPQWLGTNHFMGEGFWFWVIPLRGKTSLGLVYDRNLFDGERVSSAEKLRDWACDEFPLFARDLPNRRIVDFCAYKDFAHGCEETINPNRWALSGVSGRFTDPLYSPGSDFIALHNTLIVDAILTDNEEERIQKCRLYETLVRAMYSSLLPTYAASYDVLGDQEAFTLKYTWELSVYFAFFVFPFINDLASDTKFVPAFLSRFSRLGDLNARLQQFLSDYYQWKKAQGLRPARQVFHDFMQLEPLRRAEQTFYQVGVTRDEAKDVLDDQLVNLKELARFIIAYVYSAVLSDERVITNGSFVESIDLKHTTFDPDRMRTEYSLHANSDQKFAWTLNPHALSAFSECVKSFSEMDAQESLAVEPETKTPA